MAPEKAPAFQFYAEKFLLDEHQALMTLAQAGAYTRLMAYCWREITIPDDPDQVRILVNDGRVTRRQFREMWPLIKKCFTADPTSPGRLRHSTLDAERLKQEEWRKKSASGGRHSQAKRNHPSTTLQPPLQPNANTPSPSPSLSTPLPPKGDRDGRMEALWEHWRSCLWTHAHATAPLTPNAKEQQHLVALLGRYPNDALLHRIVEEYAASHDKGVREKPRSLGMLAHWAGEIEGWLRTKGAA